VFASKIAITAVVGLALVSMAGLLVGHLLKWATKKVPLTPPHPDMATSWQDLTGGDEGGAVIGWLERTTFFLAFWLQGGIAGAAIVAAWLTFKLGSKWQAWTQTTALPETLDGVEPLDYLVARRRWGSHVLVTFLVGTLTNVIFGLVVGVIAQHFCDLTGTTPR